MLLVSQLLWLVITAVGLGFSAITGSGQSLASAILFGTFACYGLEFLIINGAFTDGVVVSASLAAIHPIATFTIISLPQDPSRLGVAVGTGVATAVAIAAFTLVLRGRKTSRGHSAVKLFQAFMKAWAGEEATDLEAIISDHAELTEVSTKVMRFVREDMSLFIVLPGVHPGPFFPVGSYNLPSVFSSEFEHLGPVLTLHRPGGHEKNLASKDQTKRYVSQIGEFSRSLDAGRLATIRGPLHTRIGKAAVSASAFGEDLLVTISFAPLGSDDFEPKVEDELSSSAAADGFDVTVVDAHNSIGDEAQRPNGGDPAWKSLFDSMRGVRAEPLRIAYAHSSELGFSGGQDITPNGIGLLMFEAADTKSIIVLADSNNAVPNLREETSKRLESTGYQLVELCTSDSHDLAAKGLTASRGYHALGEDTAVGKICDTIVDLAKIADTKLTACRYGSGKFTSSVKVFGSNALEEFASVARSSSRLASLYLRFAVAAVAVLLALALVL